MHRRIQVALALSLGAAPAAAGSLSCTMVNGNVNCAGEGAHSCQTVNGHTVCSSGDGSVVQSFGGNSPPPSMPDFKMPGMSAPDDADDPDEGGDDATTARGHQHAPHEAGGKRSPEAPLPPKA